MIFIIVIIILLFLRLVLRKSYNQKLKMMILFGSGGHTTEMLYMFEKYNFKERNQNLYFIHSESD